MRESKVWGAWVPALLVAAGLVAAGWWVERGLSNFRSADRHVTVKGSAERIENADLVVWPLSHSVTGNDLVQLRQDLESRTTAIQGFFRQAGFNDTEVSVSPPALEDRWAYAYGDNRAPERYRYATTVTLRTTQVAKAMGALRRTGDLLAQGVVLGGSGGENAPPTGPQFDYTQLNKIKPALIAEATANARKSAEQFARDAGTRLGGIRSANQGIVEIDDRDAGSPHVKKIRVVTTVEYFLQR